MTFRWPVFIFIASLLTQSSFALANGTDDLSRLIGAAGDSSSSLAGVAVKTDNILRLTPDRTHIVRLEDDAASVIVTNPAHATVMLDSPRLLVVMPRQPGATTFTVLNGKGDIILEQDVIVTGSQARYVRIRRMCGNEPNCMPNAYFYCPDGCYEVMTVPGDTGTPEIPEIAGNAPAPNVGPLMPPQEMQQVVTPPPPPDEEEDGEPVTPEEIP